MTYSFSYLEPVCRSISSSNCCFLTFIDFSRGRSGGLVFPSLSEFSTGYCDPHSLVHYLLSPLCLGYSVFRKSKKSQPILKINNKKITQETSLRWKAALSIALLCTHIASLVTQMVKVSAYSGGDPGSIPGSGRSPGGGYDNPLQYSCQILRTEEAGGVLRYRMGSQSQA